MRKLTSLQKYVSQMRCTSAISHSKIDQICTEFLSTLFTIFGWTKCDSIQKKKRPNNKKNNNNNNESKQKNWCSIYLRNNQRSVRDRAHKYSSIKCATFGYINEECNEDNREKKINFSKYRQVHFPCWWRRHTISNRHHFGHSTTVQPQIKGKKEKKNIFAKQETKERRKKRFTKKLQ